MSRNAGREQATQDKPLRPDRSDRGGSGRNILLASPQTVVAVPIAMVIPVVVPEVVSSLHIKGIEAAQIART